MTLVWVSGKGRIVELAAFSENMQHCATEGYIAMCYRFLTLYFYLKMQSCMPLVHFK